MMVMNSMSALTTKKNSLSPLESHDTANEELYGVLRLFAERPTEVAEIGPVLGVKGEAVMHAWRDILKYFNAKHGWTSNEFLNQAATLWLSDEGERVTLLNELTPEARCSAVGDGEVEGSKAIIRTTYDDIGEAMRNNEMVVDALTAMYVDYANSDIAKYIEALKARNYMNGTDKNIEVSDVVVGGDVQSFSRKLGGHVLDILKLATGVALGVAVSSLFRRKRP